MNTAESLLTECCTSVIISSDAQSAAPFMGKYKKDSLDANGRIVFEQENGNNYLYINANEHWIVSFQNVGKIIEESDNISIIIVKLLWDMIILNC